MYRAQKRVAQQRIESKMPLRQLIDIRKKIFAEVKVSFVQNVFYPQRDLIPNSALQTWDPKSVMNDPFPWFGFRQIARCLQRAVGREASSFGTFPCVLLYGHFEVRMQYLR